MERTTALAERPQCTPPEGTPCGVSGGCTPDPDHDAEPAEVFGLWMSIAAQHRLALHRAMAKAAVHPAQAMMLRVLADHGECGQSQLADALGVSRPNVTRILQRLERSGLVTRRTDAADQRHSRVELTAAGREVVDRVKAALTEHLTSTIAQLSPADRNDLARVLRAWTELLEEATQ